MNYNNYEENNVSNDDEDLDVTDKNSEEFGYDDDDIENDDDFKGIDEDEEETEDSE